MTKFQITFLYMFRVITVWYWLPVFLLWFTASLFSKWIIGRFFVNLFAKCDQAYDKVENFFIEGDKK